MMEDLTGNFIDRYKIVAILGIGGMATVYQAFDTRLEREVAIKLIRRSAFPAEVLDHILARFEREAKSLARLSHPNIVKVHDYGEYEGSPYLVLEYLPGGDLKQRFGVQPVPWQEAVEVILPVARALQFSHRQGIIHRDIKPSNILFSAFGGPMLSDFGIAKIIEYEEIATLTKTGLGIGTPGYMAPEQWTGTTNASTDQYSLAVVLFELLTGRKPYLSDTPAGILVKQTTEPVPRPAAYMPGLPASLEAVVLKALARDPDERYRDMTAFIKALEELISIPATPPAMIIRPGESTLPGVKSFETQTAFGLPQPEPQGFLTGGLSLHMFRALHLGRLFAIAVVAVIILGLVIGNWNRLIGSIPAATPAASPTPTVVPVATLTATEPAPSPTPTQTPVPTPTALPLELTDVHGVLMRLVPAGDFIMGSDEGSLDEKPAHLVNLPAFYMDKYEVTHALYKVCVDEGFCELPLNTSRVDNPTYQDHPVIFVDWNMARAYCEWRGAHLPSEAEWEKAARGTDGRTYPWGEGIDETYANYEGKAGENTTEVGSYSKNVSPYGIFDMAGNVWEWTADWYEAYSGGDPAASSDFGEQLRVLRGGAYSYNVGTLRTYDRYADAPAEANQYYGFRCARGMETP